MASILGVIFIVGVVIAVAAWRKSSAEIAAKISMIPYSTHGNPRLRKRATGMVSMFALDAAAKQQTNLWHQAAAAAASAAPGGGGSSGEGRRERLLSTSASVGSTMTTYSGMASISSLPNFVEDQDGALQHPRPHQQNMKAMVTSLPPLSAAEILYALAEEEGSEVDEHAGAGAWGDDADGGCGDDSDEYMDVAELETPAVAAHVVDVPRPFSNVAPRAPRAPIVQTASAAPNVQVHDVQHLDSTLNCHQYVNTAAVRQLVGVCATEIAVEPQQVATEYAGTGTGEEDADAGAERVEFEAVIANSYFEMLGAQPEVVPTEIDRGNTSY